MKITSVGFILIFLCVFASQCDGWRSTGSSRSKSSGSSSRGWFGSGSKSSSSSYGSSSSSSPSRQTGGGSSGGSKWSPSNWFSKGSSSPSKSSPITPSRSSVTQSSNNNNNNNNGRRGPQSVHTSPTVSSNKALSYPTQPPPPYSSVANPRPSTGNNQMGWNPSGGRPPPYAQPPTHPNHANKVNTWGANAHNPAHGPPHVSNVPHLGSSPHAPSAPHVPTAPRLPTAPIAPSGWKVTPTNTGTGSHASHPSGIQVSKMHSQQMNKNISIQLNQMNLDEYSFWIWSIKSSESRTRQSWSPNYSEQKLASCVITAACKLSSPTIPFDSTKCVWLNKLSGATKSPTSYKQ